MATISIIPIMVKSKVCTTFYTFFNISTYFFGIELVCTQIIIHGPSFNYFFQYFANLRVASILECLNKFGCSVVYLFFRMHFIFSLASCFVHILNACMHIYVLYKFLWPMNLYVLYTFSYPEGSDFQLEGPPLSFLEIGLFYIRLR